jgi:monoamine oxidase
MGQSGGALMKRRGFLAGAALPLLGCENPQDIEGGFTGIAHERGHLLRPSTGSGQAARWPAPSVVHKTRVVIAGGGVAGLAAARALRLKGMDDFTLLELEDEAGGNSRGGMVNGISCPLGAHYLPVPGDNAPELQNLLEEFGLRQRVAGRWVLDERHLCHSPQERLFFNGEWQDGLLPLNGVGPDTLAQYQRFSGLIEQARQSGLFTIPVTKNTSKQVSNKAETQYWQAQAAITFVAYLDQNGFTNKHLRWYLDYCCRDDYGAGINTVSAWAGIHYFASRHGFHVPQGHADERANSVERDGVFTWPEGNAWLTRRLAAPLKERLKTGWLVTRIATVKHGVEVDAFNPATQSTQRWLAERCIVALPVFIAARVVENPPDFLRLAAANTRYAPWLVANIHIKTPLHDRPGPAPSWDNVIYDDASANPGVSQGGLSGGGLGYVDAMHQSLLPVPAATVLTHYRALGDLPNGRKLLMNTPWQAWRDVILADLSRAHPDLAAKTTRIDITRYGHAMAIPAPQNSDKNGLQASSDKHGKLLKLEQKENTNKPLVFAHSDWAGYSVFEEAFTLGHRAASP